MFRTLTLALILACTVGCASGRYVAKQPDGGIVAIPANTNSWPSYNRDHAHDLMRAHFPAGYVIEKEEEVVTGTQTKTNNSVKTKEFGKDTFGPDIKVHDHDQTTTTMNTTEWHIFYRKK